MQKYLLDDACLFMLASDTAFIESVNYGDFFVSCNYIKLPLSGLTLRGKHYTSVLVRLKCHGENV